MLITLDSLRAAVDSFPIETWDCPTITDTRIPSGHDSKFVAHAIQTIAQRVVLDPLARKHGYTLDAAPEKTYPDVTLTYGNVGHRIAIDAKTTPMVRGARIEWRQSNSLCMGSFNSFLQDGVKNILYPENTYHEQFVIVAVYERLKDTYRTLSVAVRRKHELIGVRQGSDNTKNIGSVQVRHPDGFRTVQGPFMVFRHAKEAADYFWRSQRNKSYPEIRRDPSSLYDHPDFRRFR